MAVRRLFPLAAACVLLPLGCLLPSKTHRAIMLGADWSHAVVRADDWAGRSANRSYQIQNLDRTTRRTYPVFDSLMLAEIYRRIGYVPDKLARFPPAPPEAGRVCRENYIFYLRGGQIVGVEYREIVSNGRGGYRQADDAIGELPGVASSSW